MPKNLTNRSEDYSKWYNELVVKADLAENSSVRGCMVIKPYGYAIWEKIQKELILNSGKPSNIVDKILEGKMKKYFSEVTLLNQFYIFLLLVLICRTLHQHLCRQ